MVSLANSLAQTIAKMDTFARSQIKGRGNSAPANMIKKPSKAHPSGIEPGKAFKTNYASNDVPIPADFLTTAPSDAQPLTIEQIDFSGTVLPEYAGCYAVVLDNVISPSECETLVKLAEASVPVSERGEKDEWQPALVNIGAGFEVLSPEYRNSDRIIWDQQTVVDRLWERCVAAPGLKEKLDVVEQDVVVLGPSRSGRVQRWEFRRLNDRMRFLRYGKGQFFKRELHYSRPSEHWEGWQLTLDSSLRWGVPRAGKGYQDYIHVTSVPERLEADCWR
jgi:hypothetical protein